MPALITPSRFQASLADSFMSATIEASSPDSEGGHSSSHGLPSPDILGSNRASPASVPSSVRSRASDESELEHRSSRSTPTRSAMDLTRSQSAGRGGCWTCRVRRKKCDEEREGDSCKTCKRLRIDCLGWGPKRPEWMRDKEKVAEYRAGIKQQLTKAGLIRGQPRAAYLQGGISSQRYTPSALAGPGPSTTSLRRSMSGGRMDYSTRGSYGAASHYHSSGLMSALPAPLNTDSRNQIAQGASMSSFVEPPFNDPLFYGSSTIPVLNSPDQLSYDALLPSTGYNSASSTPPVQGVADVLQPSITQHPDYLYYYFSHVRDMQFAFAGKHLDDILWPILLSEPRGAVANAICALSSLHYSTMQGLGGTSPHFEQSTSEFFHEQATYQIMNAKTMHGQYSDTDAIAAVYLIAFSTFTGGSSGWTNMLDVACDWLVQTGIHEEQNPKMKLYNMTAAGRFAAKATMWMDVLSSLTLVQPPRFLSLYRRLFGGGSGYWTSNEQLDLRMDSLTGCPDEAMLAIAEIAALAHWKATELRNGSLSTRDLIRRGDLIEQNLRQRPLLRSFSDVDQAAHRTPPMTDSGLPMAAGLSEVTTSPSASQASLSPSEETRRLVATIFRETAILYLHTVLNESQPAVPEISASVSTLSDLFQNLPPSTFDRAVIFPLVLTGCMADNPLMRELVRRRLLMHQDASIGGFYQACAVVETLWDTRRTLAMQGRIVDWRDCLRQRWSSLLLV